MDSFQDFKLAQKQGWAHFAPLEMVTTGPAARLVRHAGIRAGQNVLDVACGTGVVAVTAARTGAKTSGLDLTPELLDRARENGRIAEVDIDFREGDAESLPFDDESFDVVMSQFGHIFAPRVDGALSEMLRVLKKGGVIAFSTWPPELLVGRMFALVSRYMPPPPPGLTPPPTWGDINTVRERLGARVKDIVFERDTVLAPALSPQHHRATTERTSGPMLKLMDALSTADPAKLAQFRGEYDALAREYFENNAIRQGYLLTRATKI